MPEAEPVTVEFRADTANLRTGLDQGKRALREYGDETERTERRQFKLVRQSTNVLASVLAIRGAMSITTRIMEDMGIANEGLNRSLKVLELEMYAVISVLQIYRAISGLVTLADLARAKATFIAAIATVSLKTLFIGTAFAVAGALAAWSVISALTAPHAQFGGIVPPTHGGTPVIVGEAGKPEAIIPLDRAGEFGFGGGSVTVNMNVYSNDPDVIARKLARRIQQAKAAGY